MAYPTVDAPYGLKPVNLIGGQVFAGSTRNYPIQYGYATDIGYGDIVALNRGSIVRLSVTAAGASGLVGVFLGCSYTNPQTKQKFFSQNWPAGTLSGDAVAIVTDDPDTVFKGVVCSATTVVGSANTALIGQNIQMINNAVNLSNGNSTNAIAAVVGAGAPAITGTFPLRVMDVVSETSTSVSAVGSSSGTAITLTGTGLPSAILAGSDVAYITANGQFVETGSYVQANTAAGATTVNINLAIAVPGSIVAIPAGSTIVFTQYSEILVKINHSQHQYYIGAAVA
jgi:hypothetical protein